VKLTTALLITLTIATLPAYAKKDNSAAYQMGTFISSSVADDGTITNTLPGDGTTVAGRFTKTTSRCTPSRWQMGIGT
jgi:hypothetical protein